MNTPIRMEPHFNGSAYDIFLEDLRTRGEVFASLSLLPPECLIPKVSGYQSRDVRSNSKGSDCWLWLSQQCCRWRH